MLVSISVYFQWYHDNITNVYVIFVRFIQTNYLKKSYYPLKFFPCNTFLTFFVTNFIMNRLFMKLYNGVLCLRIIPNLCTIYTCAPDLVFTGGYTV